MKIHLTSCPAHPLSPPQVLEGCWCRAQEARLPELMIELSDLPMPEERTPAESGYALQLTEEIMRRT